MFSKAFTAIAALSAAFVAAQQSGQDSGFKVDTPMSASQCQPLKINWHGGEAPYYPKITKPGDVSSPLDVGIPGQTQDTSLTWKINLDEGTKFTISIGDSNGNTASSAEVTVGKGSDDCMGKKGGSSGGGGAAAAGGSSGGSSSGGSGGSSSGSSGGSSSSKSGGKKSKSSSSKSTGGAGGAAGGSSSEGGSQPSSSGSPDEGASSSEPAPSSGGDSAPSESSSPSGGDNSDKGDGASTFSGLPAVVAGVVGVAVAALI